MALPKSKPAIQDESTAQEAAKSTDLAAANMQDASVSEPRYPPTLSPARRLQSLLEAEMRGTRAPSAKRSMATVLVLSLACSVGALSLYSLGWI
ncbi:hypothetical protein [Hyphomonas sp.]|uniref:hypothetical protein n=1 Tax=Hyphomonas sp. TaxID=87 RepID=UPI000DF8F6E2|nr:hypothetical protein [Hyphomonas sp.]RCL89226.1 MAG: hypothetical protein DBW63_02325 [Hyphomonas sp.]